MPLQPPTKLQIKASRILDKNETIKILNDIIENGCKFAPSATCFYETIYGLDIDENHHLSRGFRLSNPLFEILFGYSDADYSYNRNRGIATAWVFFNEKKVFETPAFVEVINCREFTLRETSISSGPCFIEQFVAGKWVELLKYFWEDVKQSGIQKAEAQRRLEREKIDQRIDLGT